MSVDKTSDSVSAPLPSAADTDNHDAPSGLSHQVLQQAAEWFALLHLGSATPDDRRQWQHWLQTHAAHRLAWQQVERISGRFAPLQQSPAPESTALSYHVARQRMARRRQVLLGLTTLTSAGLLGWAGWRHTPMPGLMLAWTADYRSATGEVRHLTLADGTQVWLGTGSAFNADYQTDLRRLHLLSGEILIETAADSQRPFVVDTGQGRLRALGTRFLVQLGESDTTFAAVYEGAVEVHLAGNGHTALLHAGQQTRFTDTLAEQIKTADPAEAAWSRGILIARNMPLGEVVQALRRYRHGHLGLAPELADLPVFGSYPITDTDRTLDMLASVMPIRIQRTLPWWTSIEATGS